MYWTYFSRLYFCMTCNYSFARLIFLVKLKVKIAITANLICKGEREGRSSSYFYASCQTICCFKQKILKQISVGIFALKFGFFIRPMKRYLLSLLSSVIWWKILFETNSFALIRIICVYSCCPAPSTPLHTS